MNKNENEIINLDHYNENEAPSDIYTEEHVYNQKVGEDENFNSTLLSGNVTSESQQSHVLNVIEILDRNIIEGAGDTDEWNNEHKNQNYHGNGNVIQNQNLDESEGMVATTDSDNIDRWPEYCDPNYRMPGTIIVRVTLDLEERRFQVNIIKAVKCSKIYLGSFVCFILFLSSFLCFPPSYIMLFVIVSIISNFNFNYIRDFIHDFYS